MQILHTNKLVRFYDGADGLKTGHTDNAGYCLAATAKRNNLRLIAIVLGEDNATTRNNETMSLLDYGYQNLKAITLKRKNDVIKSISLDKADKKSVDIVLKDDLVVIEDTSSNKKKYDYDISIDKLNFPIKKGDNIGKIVVYSNNRKVVDGVLSVHDDINKIGLLELYKNKLLELLVGII